MDSDNLQKINYSISGQCIDTPTVPSSNRSTEDGNPSRPSSRLGFNRTMSSPCSSDTMPDSEAIQWSHSLFQNVGIPELRLSTIKAHPQARSDMEDITVKELNGNAVSDVHSPPVAPSAPNTGSYDANYNDSERSQAVPLKSPKKSVLRLSFPFVTTPSPRRNKQPTQTPLSSPLPPPPSPPPRHKYSCFPSLLSPFPPDKPSKKVERHNYPERGYSRAAMQHVKWFWSMKEQDWHGSRSGPLESIYEVPTTTMSNQTLPPLTIHPRRGDISALRDPYCVHIDRCFIGLPSWTMSKTLWMYDLHMASEKRLVDLQASSDDEQSDNDDDSDADVETSASTGFSDDSDSTLVESESEMDLPLFSNSSVMKHSEEDSSDDCDRTSSAGLQSIPDMQYDLGKISWLPAIVTNNVKAPAVDYSKPQWPTNWYARWQMLVELSRRNAYRRHASKVEAASRSPVTVMAKDFPKRNFFIGPSSYPDDTDAWNARLEHIND